MKQTSTGNDTPLLTKSSSPKNKTLRHFVDKKLKANGFHHIELRLATKCKPSDMPLVLKTEKKEDKKRGKGEMRYTLYDCYNYS